MGVKSSQKQNDLFDVRNRLKTQLVSDPKRTVFTKDGYKPVCAFCGLPIIGIAPMMHEVWITRGDVMGCDIPPSVTFTRENCVLLHPRCNVSVHTKRGQRHCKNFLVAAEGKPNIRKWLEKIYEYFKSDLVLEEIRELDSIS